MQPSYVPGTSCSYLSLLSFVHPNTDVALALQNDATALDSGGSIVPEAVRTVERGECNCRMF